MLFILWFSAFTRKSRLQSLFFEMKARLCLPARLCDDVSVNIRSHNPPSLSSFARPFSKITTATAEARRPEVSAMQSAEKRLTFQSRNVSCTCWRRTLIWMSSPESELRLIAQRTTWFQAPVLHTTLVSRNGQVHFYFIFNSKLASVDIMICTVTTMSWFRLRNKNKESLSGKLTTAH